MKVNFFIIGQPKTGTTSLYFYLKKHPDIYLPKQKQSYYFALDHNKHRQKFKKLNKSFYRNFYNYNFQRYIDKFDFNLKKKIYCDITPDYFYSIDAPKEIYLYNPNALLIAILREPIDFMKSMHKQLINSNYEKETNFKKALALETKRKRKIIKQSPVCPKIFFQYSKLVKYKNYIEKYYSLFKDNFKIIIYEDFEKNNFKYLESIQKFLKIEKIIPEKPIISNVSKSVTKRSIYKIKYFFPVRYMINWLPIEYKKYLKYIFDFYATDLYQEQKNNCIMKFDHVSLKKDIKSDVKMLNDYLKSNYQIFLDKPVDLIEYWNYRNV